MASGLERSGPLMRSPLVGFRLRAASQSLAWEPDEAVAVPEAIEVAPGLRNRDCERIVSGLCHDPWR
jgi:hypothetical protein